MKKRPRTYSKRNIIAPPGVHDDDDDDETNGLVGRNGSSGVTKTAFRQCIRYPIILVYGFSVFFLLVVFISFLGRLHICFQAFSSRYPNPLRFNLYICIYVFPPTFLRPSPRFAGNSHGTRAGRALYLMVGLDTHSSEYCEFNLGLCVVLASGSALCIYKAVRPRLYWCFRVRVNEETIWRSHGASLRWGLSPLFKGTFFFF